MPGTRWSQNFNLAAKMVRATDVGSKYSHTALA
jgi:hypothetical protein